jgi:peptide/nickel transport system substrate-binding protein
MMAAACAVLALTVAACSSSGTPGGGSPAGGTKEAGGTATWALNPSAVPNYIFPFDSSTYFSAVNSEEFQYLIYRPLYWFGNGASPTFSASLSLADPPVYHGRQVSITMKGWKWSNGETVSAQDLLFWIHMMQAVANGDWGDYVPGEFPDNVSDVKIVNATTLTMTMDKAYNPTWFTYNELSQLTPSPRRAPSTTCSGPGRPAAPRRSTSGTFPPPTRRPSRRTRASGRIR